MSPFAPRMRPHWYRLSRLRVQNPSVVVANASFMRDSGMLHARHIASTTQVDADNGDFICVCGLPN